MYRLLYRKAALKGLRRMPPRQAERMTEALVQIARNPRGYGGDWKPLAGSPYWRLRIGRFRAICEIRDESLVVLVLRAGPRGDVYK